MPRVLVTGAAGFLGAHVVEQLLTAGYEVRGTARSASAPKLRTAYASFGTKFEVAVVEDLGASDLKDAFRGIDALIHVASPLPGSQAVDVVLKNAVSRVLRILENASSAGISKVVITNSIVSLASPEKLWSDTVSLGERDYSSLTFDDAMKPDMPHFVVYCASKTLAERAIWRYAQDHPELDITTVHPPSLFGPAGRGQVLESPATGTNRFIYQLISGPRGRPLQHGAMLPFYLHIVDCARAHVLALNVPPSREPKRVVVCAGRFSWKQAVEHLTQVRPQLVSRLPDIKDDEPPARPSAAIDASSAARLLGITQYISWEETLVQTVDDLLRREGAG
ncbi:NAD-P-binding protein [Auriscalpium vulgare]|uniref:NAD-P-binding protein n=1 Tax=Auriscalpium vulgare TaxID=40419 RepID=A0ACB8S2Z3_9AGAM|nr:NAD-P-binding protein [Auriscalpium vulgare]